MKFTVLTVFACYAMLAESHPFLGLDLATGIGNGLGSAVGNGVGLGVGTAVDIGAGALGLGVGVANGLANGVANGLGLGVGVANGLANGVANGLGSSLGVGNGFVRNAGFGLGGVAQRASNYQQGRNSGANQYNTGASGAHDEDFHQRGEKNFHDRGHHHSSVTKITKAENSDEHDIGGSEAIDVGAHSSGAYKKHANGAANYDNNYRRGEEQAASYI